MGSISYLPGFEPDVDEWTNDDWETPSPIAQQIGALIRDDERFILEPAAGTGQILRFIKWDLDPFVVAVELKPDRFNRGRQRCSGEWINSNFLFDNLIKDWTPDAQKSFEFDLIVTNPPFSLRMEFIERSLSFLRPNGRLLFLMPIDFNCGLRMGNKWKQLDCHIHHVYRIQNRIAYLNAKGKPQSGRQVYDAVFDIRLGKLGGVTSFLGEVQS